MRRNQLLVLGAALAAAFAGPAHALTVPFTEDFAADPAGWLDNASAPATFVADGGPDGSSHATAGFNYFGFANPFGPVIFRANDAADASGDAFVGDWLAAGVKEVSAYVYQDTGEPLTFFLRVATPANFPGAAFPGLEPVPSGVWTRVSWYIDTDTPWCLPEVAPCASVLPSVGNVQIGTDAPTALTLLDETFTFAVDQVTITTVPEPGQLVLAAAGALALALAGRGRRR